MLDRPDTPPFTFLAGLLEAGAAGSFDLLAYHAYAFYLSPTARVQTVADLERRVQEMNAFTRVSQGVNVTLTFDDVLELIYTQATQILPSSLFHITLYNKAGNYFYYAFRVDDNKRMTSRENQPLPATLGLGAEIIRKGRQIITQEYVRECQTRNLIPSAMGVYAWVGVPLKSGSETMGALSIGSRAPTVNYTRAQLDLLQAIADQTVGAIVIFSLLEHRRALRPGRPRALRPALGAGGVGALLGAPVGRQAAPRPHHERFLKASDFSNPVYWLEHPKFNKNCEQVGDWGIRGRDWLQEELRKLRSTIFLPRYWDHEDFGKSKGNHPVI